MSKVLVIVERFYPEDFLVNDLVAEWKKLGDEVEVLTQVPSYPFDRIFDGYKNKAYQTTREYLDIPVHRVSTIFGYNTSVKRKVLNYLHFGWMTFWWALWNGRKYDRVFVYHTAALTMASALFALKTIWRKPTTIWTQDLWPDAVWGFGFRRTRGREAFLNWFVRRIYKRCDRICVSCRGFVPRIREICNREAEFIPQWDPAPMDLPPAPPHTGIVFMFAGNLGVPQDLDNVLEGFTRADIPDAELHFVGGGVQLEHIKEKATASGARAVFHGRQPKADMPRWFAQADALIISLTPEYQLTLPGKFQSYIKTGKPILGILLGDARELIEEHQLGVTAPPDDLDAIADAFRRMAELIKRGAGPACGARARQLSEQMFDRTRLIAALRRPQVLSPKS